MMRTPGSILLEVVVMWAFCGAGVAVWNVPPSDNGSVVHALFCLTCFAVSILLAVHIVVLDVIYIRDWVRKRRQQKEADCDEA